ncbi:CDP-diacylglycerol--glycerol-3-phosphate 3-phosphatidyltransferase [Mesoplasma syrphidae]|uniref:CDP-diacylglycerol--glycerol-3-phosphate 3-phosphatidyltransferase n=1 Tax=Mesoplasma syrphidae TaxID=225999 RepID=A0A2K9C4P6_9MOLU|nr:CDP-diacylglycerol--glycerol-3-phosphate 3-phosphatidyltransferase [Mesoplasma syrphidae]AUF83257.1 CDP-diacylglycerol--glycerol-3-phosphate 3-phosphatidyltransferase [Mesoplasma syrphidae]
MDKKPIVNAPNILTLIRLILVPVVICLILVSYYAEMQDSNSLNWQWTLGTFGKYQYKLPILWMAAGIVFILASLTDFLDGYLARRNNQVTDFGKFFDPIADKLLVNSALILLAVAGIIPLWMVLILILRDTIVDFIRMILSSKQITLAAGMGGKLKTLFQMVGLSLLFFVNFKFFASVEFSATEYGWINQVIMIPMYIATFFSIYSGTVYFCNARKNLF